MHYMLLCIHDSSSDFTTDYNNNKEYAIILNVVQCHRNELIKFVFPWSICVWCGGVWRGGGSKPNTHLANYSNLKTIMK